MIIFTSPVKLYTRKVENKMKREAVNENVRFAALEKTSFSKKIQIRKPNLKNAVLRITLISSLRASCTRRANDFSHVYILITFIPLMISFISLIRRSVLIAVSTLNLANCRPIQD